MKFNKTYIVYKIYTHAYVVRTLAEVASKSLTAVTLPTAEILSGKDVRAWVSMVLYFKK